MKLQRVDITNYGSFQGNHHFQLSDRGLVIVLGDNQDEKRLNSNGAGKSTIFDSLDWALFGKIPRGDHVDSIINENAGKDPCVVTVSLLDDDDQPVRVVRTQGKGAGLVLFEGLKNVSSLDKDETQKRIEAILGLDRDVFHAAVLFGQTDLFRFADSTSDVERMKILTKILQLEDIDVWAEKAKAMRTTLTESIQDSEMQIATMRGQISTLEQEIPGYDQQSTQWENERAEALRQGVQTLDQHRVSIEQYEKVTACRSRVEVNLKLAMESIPVPLDLTTFDDQLAVMRTKATSERAEAMACTNEGKRLNIEIDQMERLGVGKCTRCGVAITPEHIASEVADLSGRRDTLRERYKTHDASAKIQEDAVKVTEASREYNRKVHYEADRTAIEAVAEARKQMSEVTQSEEYLRKAHEYVDHLRKTMADTQGKLNPWLDRRGEAEAKIQGIKAQANDLDTRIEGVSDKINLVDFWVKAFGPTGLKNYILDSKLQEMTDAANQWVKLLTGGTVWIRFETQTKGRKSKTLSNKLNVRVFRYNPDGSISERNYKSWSGGEKQRVSLGIDFGLSRLIANRARKRYDVLILDELFKHLDQAGRDALVELLQHLRKEKASVFVVDHDSTFQGSFENVVTVQKKNGQSTIVEEDNGLETQPKPKAKLKRVPARNPVPKRRKRATV